MPSEVWDEIIYPFPNFNGKFRNWEIISSHSLKYMYLLINAVIIVDSYY